MVTLVTDRCLCFLKVITYKYKQWRTDLGQLGIKQYFMKKTHFSDKWNSSS